MLIDSLQTTKIITYLNSKDCHFQMTLTDWRVFLEWLAQDKDYDVSGIQIQNRTGIKRSNVSFAFKRLKDNNILVDNGKKRIGKGKAVVVYNFHPEFKVMVENHWKTLTKKIEKAPEITEDIVDGNEMLDIPIEEFQPLTIDEDFCNLIGYVKSDYES